MDMDIQRDREAVMEKVREELPGFQIDFEQNACWGSRKFPGQKAAEEVKVLREKGYDAFVVWLSDPVETDMETCMDYQPGEAIIIQNYLDTYILVKEIHD